MKRFIRFSHQDAPIGEISPNDVMSLVRREEINGEHSLTITTLQVLGKGERIVYQDERGIWREYEVTGVDEEHAAGNRIIGTYYCVWSIQQDLQGVTVSKMPGVQTPVTAALALTAVLETQTRWTVGTVTNTNTGGASMYDMSAWQALSVLLENWGGELSTSITVSNAGVIARHVDYYTQQGEQTAKRRYDFGKDMKSIKRTIADEPLFCRISPRGKGEQTDGGGYGRKITIASVNGGNDYLEYSPMVNVAKIPNGNGGWQYPTKIIENGNCETPADLKTWAQSIIATELTPKVTYDIDVMQAAREGVDVQGVSLGDAVHAVDRYFTDDGLRVTGRIVSTEVDEITGIPVSVTLGFIRETLGSKLASTAQIASTALNSINSYRSYMNTAGYIDSLLTRINAEINADGGYTYITQGEGLRTYDVAVSDPLVGAEASKAVEIKGGSIRIANTKTAQGEWNWRTVFTSGHIAADMVTAANITAGFIGSASSGNYWNLDTGELQMSTTTKVGNQTLAQYIGSVEPNLTQTNVFNALTHNGQTQGIYLNNGLVYINGTYIQSGQINANYITTGNLLVKDASNNTVFSADMDTRQVSLAGFTAKNNALYNGLGSVSGSGVGVYVGTDGVASSSGAYTSALVSGGLVGFRNGSEVGRLVANGATGSGVDTPIKSVALEFIKSNSGTSITGGYSWSTTPPTTFDTSYVWFRTKVVGTDNKVSYTEPYSMAVNGTGDWATTALRAEYYLSTSSTSASGGSWSTTKPTWSSGRYIWTRCVRTHASGDWFSLNPKIAVAFNSQSSSTLHGMQMASEVIDLRTPNLTVSTHSEDGYESYKTVTDGVNIGHYDISVKPSSNGNAIQLRPANRNASFTNGMLTALGSNSYSATYYVPSESYVNTELDKKLNIVDAPVFVLQGSDLYIYSSSAAASA